MTEPRQHPKDGWPMLPFRTRTDLESWLEQHHGDDQGIWVMLAKKGRGIASVTLEEAIESFLCFGWVDSKGQRVDDDYWAVRAHVRKPRSSWSQRNMAIVARLTTEGRIRPSGQAQVDAARADGRWGA